MRWTAFLQQLRSRDTLLTTLVVGTLVNLYGQVLVPLLRGMGDALAELSRNLTEVPLLAFVSIALGYTFPWLVSAYAGARARVDIEAAASLAQFPDLKPDPVFRAREDGTVDEAGAQTRVIFDRHRVERAQEILGAELWARIADAIAGDGLLPAPETVYFAPADKWYAVAASNVYLAAVPRSVRDASDRPGLRGA